MEPDKITGQLASSQIGVLGPRTERSDYVEKDRLDSPRIWGRASQSLPREKTFARLFAGGGKTDRYERVWDWYGSTKAKPFAEQKTFLVESFFLTPELADL